MVRRVESVAWNGSGYKEKIKIWGAKWKGTTMVYQGGDEITVEGLD